MEKRTSKDEALEAGEDGAFDLGDPSPPSPLMRRRTNQQPDPSPTATIASPPRSPRGIHLDEVAGDRPTTSQSDDVQEEISQPSISDIAEFLDDGAASGTGTGDDFEDAVSGVESQAEDHGSQAVLNEVPSVVGHASFEDPPRGSNQLPEPPRRGASKIIAAGLADVPLPMPFARWRATHVAHDDGLAGAEDSEGEFHDAYDSVLGLNKDAGKAKGMKETGNSHYQNGDFEEAADFYSMALEYCPDTEEYKEDRAVYLGNRAACHMQTKEYEAVVEDCTSALELKPDYVKALLRRAQANESLEKFDLAVEDMQALVKIDSTLKVAKQNIPRLEKLQQEKMEKMKDEAIGKLKDLGNSVLGHFGLSVDNFKMKQDPNTGSYSINFER